MSCYGILVNSSPYSLQQSFNSERDILIPCNILLVCVAEDKYGSTSSFEAGGCPFIDCIAAKKLIFSKFVLKILIHPNNYATCNFDKR